MHYLILYSLENEWSAQKRTHRSSNFKNLYRSGTTWRRCQAKEYGQHGHWSLHSAADIAADTCGGGNSSIWSLKLPPCYTAGGDQRERAAVAATAIKGRRRHRRRHLRRRWRWPPLIASRPTRPSHAAAGLLIWRTVTAGARTHGVLRSARQHGLQRLYAAYIVCQKRRARRAWIGAGPKKDQRPVRSNLGPARSRTRNWTGSNSSTVTTMYTDASLWDNNNNNNNNRW